MSYLGKAIFTCYSCRGVDERVVELTNGIRIIKRAGGHVALIIQGQSKRLVAVGHVLVIVQRQLVGGEPSRLGSIVSVESRHQLHRGSRFPLGQRRRVCQRCEPVIMARLRGLRRILRVGSAHGSGFGGREI